MLRTLVTLLALLFTLATGGATASRHLDSFTIAGCECTAHSQTVILGWRGIQPGNVLRAYRDSAVVYQGANPQGPAFNVYLYNQPVGQHGYQVCTGVVTNVGFTPQACSQVLPLTVT